MFSLTFPMTQTASHLSNQLLNRAFNQFQILGTQRETRPDFEKQPRHQTGLSMFQRRRFHGPVRNSRNRKLICRDQFMKCAQRTRKVQVELYTHEHGFPVPVFFLGESGWHSGKLASAKVRSSAIARHT